jgi:hypothetical protein
MKLRPGDLEQRYSLFGMSRVFSVEKIMTKQQEALMDVIKSRHVPDLDYRYVTCFCE